MEHADQARALRRQQIEAWQDRAQQASPRASELHPRQQAFETFKCEVEERLEASLGSELVKALEQHEICETLLDQEFRGVEEKVDLEDVRST
jgi:hypothetical protein